MKSKKLLVLLLASLGLTGCTVSEGLSIAKNWFKDNVYSKVPDNIKQVLQPNKEQKEEEKKEDQQPSGGEQGGQEGQEGGGEETKNSYTISFVNGETVLQSGKVEEGVMPEYKGEEPTKEGDAQYSYTFNGWEPEVVVASADATYTATFTQSVNKYTVKFVNYDDSVLQTEQLEYGAMPEYKGEQPAKPETDAATFAFAGWDKQIVAVTGDATYKATFNSVAKEYMVTFKNGDQVLQQGKVAYGETPVYAGENPTKEATEQYEYTFNGWDPELAPVTGDATYQAQFAETLRQYQVSFDSHGGSEVAPVMVNYGEHVAAPTAPTKESDAEHFYFFDGWQLNGVAFDFENAVITGAITLDATWDAVSATEHAHRCTYTHYAEKAADYVNNGYKEFWMCELHHTFVMSAPTEGTVNEATAPFAGEILDSDARYIAPLEGGNKYISMDIKGWQDPALVYTNDTYTDVTALTFKMRVTAAAEDMTSIWGNIGIGADHNDWTNHKGQINLASICDGQWHLISKYSFTATGYINFCYNMDHNIAGRIEIDDVRIEHAGGTTIETFEDLNNLKIGFDNNYARIEGEKRYDNYMRLTPPVSYDDSALVYTLDQYTNVTKVEYKMRVNDIVTKQWQGIAVNTTAHGVDQYTNMMQNDSYATDGKWYLRSHTFSSVSGYVNFIKEVGHFEVGSIDIDDLVIYHDGGVTVETFNGELCLVGSQMSYYSFVSIRNDAQEVIKNVAVDARTTELEKREYSPTFEVSRGVDAEYGPYLQIDNWQANANENRTWLGFKYAESKGKVEWELGKAIESYYFYFYNPSNSNLSMAVQNKRHYTSVIYFTAKAQEWTKVDIPISKLDSPQTADLIGFDHTCSANGELVGSGFKVTSVYGYAAPSSTVNPAPYGVVAWDAENGGVRDIKGRSNTATVTHGIDDTNGAYIQLDDWTCGANSELAWLTLSDTAKTVSEVEAELGKSITNYFFYVYNPLGEQITLRVMFAASAGPSPAINVTIGSHEWEKVTIDYGHEDPGKTPFTVASQIGLDYNFGSLKGQSMGSGWKITSVYAE